MSRRETAKNEHYLTTNTTFLNSYRKPRKTLHIDTVYWFQVALIIRGRRSCSYTTHDVFV